MTNLSDISLIRLNLLFVGAHFIISNSVILLILGDWIAIVVHLVKHFNGADQAPNNTIVRENGTDGTKADDVLEYLNLKGLPHYLSLAITGSFIIYFGVGGFIHVSMMIENQVTETCD